jgi:hypothetical protein
MWIGLYVAPGSWSDSLEALAQVTLQFTPHVTIEAPDLLLLDVGASLQLFGGPEKLLQRLRTECTIAGATTIWLATAPRPTRLYPIPLYLIQTGELTPRHSARLNSTYYR